MRLLWFFAMHVCVCSISTCFASESKPAFRVLIVHQKGSLHGMHKVDAKGMKKTFKSIANAVEKPIYLTQKECSNASMKKISKWCSKINKHDIAVLYYSGPNPDSVLYKGTWPTLAIGSHSISLDKIANEVHSRKARLSLVFADCYSQYLKPNGISRRPYGHPLEKVKKKSLLQKIRKVWLSEKGSLTMCSNKQGASSYGVILEKSKFGAFTEALLMTIVSGTHGRGEVVKLSDFPRRINAHMSLFPFSIQNQQYPFYQSTITEAK